MQSTNTGVRCAPPVASGERLLTLREALSGYLSGVRSAHCLSQLRVLLLEHLAVNRGEHGLLLGRRLRGRGPSESFSLNWYSLCSYRRGISWAHSMTLRGGIVSPTL